MDVRLIRTPRNDKFDHMLLSGTRMHTSGLAFIILLEHGVPHYQNTEAVVVRHGSCIFQFHVYRRPRATLSLSLPSIALKSPIRSSLSVRGMPLSKRVSWL